MSKFIQYNHYDKFINVNEIEEIINPFSNNCYLILKNGSRLKYEFKTNILYELRDVNKVIQIIEPKEPFYNVYLDEDESNGDEYMIYPVEYLGLTNGGDIIGIELDKYNDYIFTTYLASNYEFVTNKKGLEQLLENGKIVCYLDNNGNIKQWIKGDELP